MIEELLKRIALQLDNNDIPYMVIGGQAVLVYGTPRLTRDIDITLGIDTDKFPLVETVCKSLGLKMLPEKPEDFAIETKVLPAEETELYLRVDFIFSFTPYEMQALNRVKKIRMSGYPVKFASLEDVIVHKMIAGRAIDEEDIKNMVLKNRKKIDLSYIRKWLLEFGKIPEQKGISGRFETLLRQIVR